MLDPEMRRAIRHEIKQQMNVILNCVLQDSTTEDQVIDQVYPGAPPMQSRPIVHPYGLVSRAPAGTIGVTARVGEHMGARMILGCRDSARADMELAEGDVRLYDAFGNSLCLDSVGLKLGSPEADNPVPLGNETKELLTAIVDAIIAGTLVLTSSPGFPTSPNPTVVATFTELKTRLLTTGATNILATKIFAEKGT